jgi:hypothetical protein
MWLTWRQFRAQAAAVFAAVAAAAVVLAVTGPGLSDLARTDPNLLDRLSATDLDLYYAAIVVMAVAPAVIGAFWGAPMVARELEAGTHRLAWNHSITRTRWLATKLGLTALAAAAAVGLLSLAVSWWSAPIDGALSNSGRSLPSRLTPIAFAMRGVAPAAYAVFALVLGVAFGIVLRRPLPAMAVTLAVFTFVQIAVPLWVRPRLIPPVSQTVALAPARVGMIISDGPDGTVRIAVNTANRGDWVLVNQTLDATGKAGTLPSWIAECFPPPPSSASSGPSKAPSLDSCLARLTDQGYRQRVVYQPANRFWPLQLTEAVLYLALAGLLAWFCFWWTRRRLS